MCSAIGLLLVLCVFSFIVVVSDYHKESIFKRPKVHKDILREESRELFERFLVLCPKGGIHDWVKTII